MTKTNTALVAYVKAKIGTAYVYGAKMEILTRERFNYLKKTFGSMVPDSDVSKVGMLCCDCSGLISGYTGVHRTSSGFKEAAKQVHPISTIKQAPVGAIVWKSGHVGVYIGIEDGTPYYVGADGSAYGCRKAKLPSNYTHWFLNADIKYENIPGNAVNNTAGAIAVGSSVFIKAGSVYGGAAATRGKAVSEQAIGRKLTVDKIETHNGSLEARLKEISSWVSVNSLKSV